MKRSPLAGVVGALVVVEATSGLIQGYYTPLLSDVARHLDINDAHVNWFEAAQLLLSAMVVPVLARLGDMWGHRKVLIGSLIATALAAWAVAFAPSFWLFTVVWALMGFYVVWLPMNVAIIHARARQFPNAAELTRKGAGVIVVALQAGAIGGALLSGQLAQALPLWAILSVPAAVTTAALVVVIFKVPDTGVRHPGALDTRGIGLLSFALVAITGGLGLVRLDGVTWWVVGTVVVGLVALAWFVRYELGQRDPLIDMRLIARPTVWPVMLTSGLFGVSVLGAQGPLSTFAGTDPLIEGYGLGLPTAQRSYLIGGYVLSLLIGAATFARLSKWLSPRLVLLGASIAVAAGYLALIPVRTGTVLVASLVVVAGLGSGALVAALPAAAAAAAPPHQTGVATGLTNTTKTLGGALASALFALALASGADDSSTAASLTGYQTVWAVCGLTALGAAIALLTVPKQAFTGAHFEDAGLTAVDDAEELKK